MLNQNKLKAKIIEKGLSVEKVAQLLNVNTATLYRKISSGYFLIGEVGRLQAILNLSIEEIDEIFLTKNSHIMPL